MSTCITTPEQPYVPGTPSRAVVTPVYGWDAGANSLQQYPGDARIRFTMEPAIGVVLGLTNTRDNPESMPRISHGFLFNKSHAGTPQWQVIEAGVVKTGPGTYTGATEFRVDRAGTQVSYFVNGALVYASRTPFTGMAICATALYASGDTVPGEAW